METSYVLSPGINSDITIKINRRVYDFEASVTGTISGEATVDGVDIHYEGNVLIVAYTGDIGIDFDQSFDVEDILGFEEIELTGTPEAFTIDILPYGHNVPVEDVYIIALFDANGNKKADDGEYIGYYSLDENQFPTLITINEGTIDNINLCPVMQVPAPSGYTISISGTIEKPTEFYALDDPSNEKVYFIIAKVEDTGETDPSIIMEQISEDPFHSIKYFGTLPLDSENFDIDLSETDVVPGDIVLLAAIWDTDPDTAFPEPEKGDFIGLYIDEDSGDTTYTIQNGENSDILIKLNREIFDYDIELRGWLKNGTDCACDNSDVMIVAYTGEISSFDFADQFDINGVVGFQKAVKTGVGEDFYYTVPIFPYGKAIPITNVYLIAMCDVNGNGTPDVGDKIGFYVDPDDTRGLPALLNINNYYGKIHWDECFEAEPPCDPPLLPLDINFSMTLNAGSGYSVPLVCKMDMPHNQLYNRYSKPVYIMIAETTSNNPADILNSSLESIKYFQKITPPLTPPEGIHTIDITLDLSETTLTAGSQIIIAGIWDLDNAGGFPFPTVGDYIGFYMNLDEYNPVYTLKSDVNDLIEFELCRQVYEFEDNMKSITGVLTEHTDYADDIDTTGDVTIVAYADNEGMFTDFDFASSMDINKVIGMVETTKFDGIPKPFTLDLMPYLTPETYTAMTAPEGYVYLFAFVDKNGDGMPNPAGDGIPEGDIIGYYTTSIKPETFSIPALTPKDITFITEYPPAGEYVTPLPINIELGTAHTAGSGPIYYTVIKNEHLDGLMEGNFELDPDLEMLSYLPGVISPLEPPGPSTYCFTKCVTGNPLENDCLDLSEPSLDPVAGGDRVAVFALWDKVNPGAEIPTIEPGDYVGFYMDVDNLSPFYTLRTIGDNATLNIDVKYEVFDFDASVSGTITGLAGTEDLYVIAYAGNLDSFDMSAIDFNKVIGFKQITGVSGSSMAYTLSIMPYFATGEGTVPPFYVSQGDGVYIIAYQDCNGSGVPDGGDRIGAYMTTQSNGLYPIPTQIDITHNSSRSGTDIDLMMEMSAPAGYNINVTGIVDNPPGANNQTLFLILASAEGGSMSAFLSNPIATMKAMQKTTFSSGSTTSYSINIEDTSLAPGDDIAVMAVWDIGYVRGFVNPSAGDCMGFYINGESMTFTVTIGANPTVIPQFRLDKRVYIHNSSVRFRLDNDYMGTPSNGFYQPGDNVMVTVIQEDGVTLSLSEKEMDPNYVVAMGNVQIPTWIDNSNATSVFEGTYYTVELLPMIYDPSIYVDRDESNNLINGGQPYVTSPFQINNVYMFVVLDNAPADGGPTSGECMGYFWYSHWLYGSYPQLFNVYNQVTTPPSMESRGVRIFTESMYRVP